MANRNNYRSRNRFDSDYDSRRRNRQQEQFSSGDYDGDFNREYNQGYGQMGESAGYDVMDRDDSFAEYEREPRSGGSRRNRNQMREQSRNGGQFRNQGDAQMVDYGYGQSRYDNGQPQQFGSFNSESYGGRDYVARDSSGRNEFGARNPSYGTAPYSASNRSVRNEYGERGFFEKAGDEIASWFGDERAEERRRMDHRGNGPKNYTRSDERILEDCCDELTEDWDVDARDIQVTVEKGEVTLDGNVSSRRQKREAEDCVHEVSGVSHVQNNLRVQDMNRSQETETAYTQTETTS